ncbi:hypothetical protein AB0L65_33265 [Nonomuraea sp. NPDC052116]|uniref:hypothetical protein n=1 Tax=Nonomuraea sp. NPDC052116 TaxID=3155665 RepID=UPI0034317C52
MKGQGKNLLATIGYATVAVVAGIGLAASGGMDGKSATSDSRTLFKVTETKDQPKKTKKPRLVGVVSGHTDTGLLIAPFSDAPVAPVKATAVQREKCPLDARYPDCLR